MCTVVLSILPDDPWPVVFAGNRDELRSRPARPPGRWWDDRPEVRAGYDEIGGGSWLGLNDFGLVACVLNRAGALGPAPGKRSRGELVLEALDHADATAAATALSEIDPGAYRPFNFVVADNRDAFWLRHEEPGRPVRAIPLPPGLSMITAHDRNSHESVRQTRWRAEFEAAPRPDPEAGDWSAWTRLLAQPATPGAPPRSGMRVADGDFGTVSSALLALPAIGRAETDAVFHFADGPPGQADYAPVTA